MLRKVPRTFMTLLLLRSKAMRKGSDLSDFTGYSGVYCLLKVWHNYFSANTQGSSLEQKYYRCFLES